MNLREQKLIWRISKMRTNLAQAQRRQAIERATLAAALHNAGAPTQDCACPACTIKRALASAIATGTGVVRMSVVDLDDSAPTNEPPKH